ncbi:MAG: beta strand repeat-containing protein [Solirubrobacteraceae bacterium]
MTPPTAQWKKMSIHTEPPARRALALAAVTGACLVAALGIATDQASADCTAGVQAGTLQLTGDGASDTLVLSQGAANTLDVTVNGQLVSSFDRSTFTAVAIDARGGNDTVNVQNMAPALENVTIDGGAGDDTLIGGAGAETFIGGAGNDFVDGNIGADSAQLGTGNDTFQWDPGDGSDTVDGQSGKDTLAFNGSNIGENINVAANGSRVRLTRDVAGITMDLDGIESAAVRALGGSDTVTVGDLTGTDLATTNVDLNGFAGDADGAADTVIAQGTDQADDIDVGSSAGNVVVDGPSGHVAVAGNEAALDNVTVAALGGADTVNAGVAFTGPIPVTVDGGDGSDTTTYSGTNADDTIGIARNGTAAVAVFTPAGQLLNNTAVEELTVKGLGGADTITGQNGIGALTHLTIDGAGGDDTIAGGDGADTLLGGAGDDHVDGNIGADSAQLGTGNDTFQWDPGDGSDTVDGQAGKDTLAFNGSNAAEKIDLTASGSHAILHRDVAGITMDLDGIESTTIRALGSADIVTVGDLAGTDLNAANVDLNAFDGTGDGSSDTVIANGTDDADDVTIGSTAGNAVVSGLSTRLTVSGNEPALDNVDVDTLGGNDTISSGVGFTGPIPVTVDGGDGADTTTYSGTNADDTIGIARTTATAVGVFTPNSQPVNNTAVEELVVQGLGGADTITGQNGIGTLTHLTLDGGSGDDQLRGGDGADTLLGGAGDDFVDGNIGADTAQLGGGADTFQWDPGDGSDTVDGQGGNDTLAFNGSNIGEEIHVAANGSRVRLTRNVGVITMDVNDVESTNIRALGGADTITVDDLAGTDLKAANVDLSAFDGTGDGSADTVVLNGSDKAERVRVNRAGDQVLTTGLAAQTTIAGSEAANDTLRVNTLGGRDDVQVAPDVRTLITPVVDLGADQ